jgi:peptidoglycan/LPS O-acetylase OafA/YrhL
VPLPPISATETSPSRLDGIDLLRGLAIFFVLMNHVHMRLLLAHIPYTQGLPKQLVSALVWNGERGVQIFFAISGFLITSTTLRRWKSLRDTSLRGFYLMRFARIAPLLVLLLIVLSTLHLANVHNFVVKPETGGLPRALLAALTFHVNVLEAHRGYLPGNWDILWSLSVEEMFYLFFPLAARLLGRGKLFVILLFAFIAAGPFARTILSHGNEVWQEYSYLGGMDAIALGCLTALLLARRTFSPRFLRIFATLGALLLIFSLCFTRQPLAVALSNMGLDMTLIALATCFIIIAAAQSSWRAPRFLSPLINLGQRSYEVYLTHMFVVFAMFGIFLHIGQPLSAVIPLFLIVTGLSALLGEIVARLYSEPLNRLIRARWPRPQRSERSHLPDLSN